MAKLSEIEANGSSAYWWGYYLNAARYTLRDAIRELGQRKDLRTDEARMLDLAQALLPLLEDYIKDRLGLEPSRSDQGSLSSEEKRDAVVTLLRNSHRFWDIAEIIDEMQESKTPDDFDICLEQVYDFADERLIWLGTR